MMTARLHILCSTLLLLAGSMSMLADDEFNPSLPPEPQQRVHVVVSADDANGATVSGDGWYTIGQTITVSCTPKTNYKFRYWALNGDSCSASASYRYTVGQTNVRLVAYTRYVAPTPPVDPVDPTFDPSLPGEPGEVTVFTSKIYMSAEPSEAGYFSRTSGISYVEGTTVSLCCYANEGYELVGWYSNDVQISDQQCINVTVPVPDLKLVAKFQKIVPPVVKSYIYLQSNKTNACTFNIQSGLQYEAGTRVLIARTPTHKYEWVGWFIGENLISTDSVFSYKVTKNDVTIQARFQDFFDPTVPSDPGGGGGSDVDNPITVMITAPDKPGYIFDHWNDGNYENPRSVPIADTAKYTPIYIPMNYTMYVQEHICQGDSFKFGKQWLTEENVYRDTLKASNTGDSVIVLSLFVHQPYDYTKHATIYIGDSVQFDNQWYKKTGEYTNTYSSIFGCDSIRTLDLNVIDTIRQFTVVAKPQTPNMGSVSGSGLYAPNSMVQLIASGRDGLQFTQWTDGNTDNPRTVVITSDSTFIAVFEGDTVRDADTVIVTYKQNISSLLVGEKTHIIVKETGQLVVDEPTQAASLTLCQSNVASAQVMNVSDLTVQTADMVLRLEPEASKAVLAKWYAFGVPFDVAVKEGIRSENASYNAIAGYDFVIDRYDGAARADSNIKQGWKRCQQNDVLQAGQFYMMAVNGTQNEWRFTKKADATVTNKTNVAVYQYSSSAVIHAGWNGVSNAMMQKATAQMVGLRFATVYHNASSTYETVLLAQSAFDASHPFFVQVANNGSILFSEAAANAPVRVEDEEDEPLIHTISLQNEAYTDKAYLSASKTKENAFTIGLDLEKMQSTNTAVPQLWLVAYDLHLAAHEAMLVDKSATVPVGLYAPADGEYTLSTTAMATTTTTLFTTITLLENGNEVEPDSVNEEANTATWTLNLTKGTNSNYALQIGEKEEISTELYMISFPSRENRGETVKFIQNGTLYIKRGGKIYTAQGVEVK